MNSPSPQTMNPGNRLNHLPVGTSHSSSSRRANSSIWSAEILLWRIRARRCASKAWGSLARRIPGMGFAAVEAPNNLLLQPVGRGGVGGVNHALGQSAQLFRAERGPACDVPRKLSHLSLLIPRQPFDRLNDFDRCHRKKLRRSGLPCKRRLNTRSGTLEPARV
jgi:hypothetical protein